MLQAIWRVEALALPTLALPCERCARRSPFECTERFRVNANGAELDVWLLYRCAGCGAPHKHRIERRVRASRLPPGLLAGYQGDDPELVRRWAFALGGGAEVAWRVERAAIPSGAALHARIEQPEPCGVRWDRLLARELGCSRARVGRAAARGIVCVNGAGELRRSVADGDSLELATPAWASGV